MRFIRFGPFLAAAFLFFILMAVPTGFLEHFINAKTVEEDATTLSPVTFQGVVIQEKMLKDSKYLPVFGSSELSRMDQFHPSNYFKANPAGFTPFLIGRGGTQSLVQFLDFAAVKNNLKNKKIVFILSPQWFTPKGLDNLHFGPNFSTLQAYRFALDRKLDPELKKRAAKRLLTFTVVKNDPILATLLKNSLTDDRTLQMEAAALRPVAEAFMKILERKDLISSISDIETKLFEKKKELPPKISWENLRKRAEMIGQRETVSNPFSIYDPYYKLHIASRLMKLKNFKAGQSFEHSVEYSDLQLVLDLLKQEHVKALFISIPVNGYWYDFAGFPKEGRERYYEKVRRQIISAGFQIADYSSHEYDRYFLKDTMHLGWKGWTYLDRDIKDFVKTGSVQTNN